MMRHLCCDFRSLFAVFGFCLALGFPLAPAQAAGWREGAPMTTARANAGGVLVGDDLYVIGGSSTSGPRSLTEVYDTVGDIWRAAAPLSVGIEQFGIATDGRSIFVAGGYEAAGTDGNDDYESDALWIFDVKSGVWSDGPRMPGWRVGLSLAVVGDKVYALGGRGSAEQRIYVYDQSERAWTVSRVSDPAPRTDSAVIVVDGLIYVIGGKDRNGASARVDIFDPAKGTWRSGPAMPAPREGHVAALLNGEIHVSGGQSINPPRTFADHFVLDLKTNRWRTAVAMPTPRHASVAAVNDGRLFVVGGAAGAGVYTVFTASDVVDIYSTQ
jgi:N-acetylneuraminic acid mutarotase